MEVEEETGDGETLFSNYDHRRPENNSRRSHNS